MLSSCSKHSSYIIRPRVRYSSATTKLLLNNCLPGPAYKPELVEKDAYQLWEDQDCFKPDDGSTEPTFSMVLPPPNVTGKLHLGHALGSTIQDVIVRRQRALGNNVAWVPGTDHAGIATQTVVENYLKNANHISDRHHLGREQFNKEAWKWKVLHGDIITKQLRILGCSLDWSKETFTLNSEHTKAVNAAFKTLFSKGLIYRKTAIVNWCTTLSSTVSDAEVDYRDIKGVTMLTLPGYTNPIKFGQLYSFAYKIFGTNKEIVVSTTTPETMLGDMAVAINPKDPRFEGLAGKRLYHPFKTETIPIIVDEVVNMTFGTGAVKVTPAHSKVDFEVAERHNLPMHQVIDESGKMIDAGEFTNLNRYDCRDKIVSVLEDKGFMRSIEPHNMSLPICSRTGSIIEYLPKEQWFVSCKSMNQKAKEAVLNGDLEIMPEKYLKNWLDWTDGDRDWCISRQLWWGHQIPAYKCSVPSATHISSGLSGSDPDDIWVAATDEDEAKSKASNVFKCSIQSIQVERDTDVLDTWFSSGIYPFACFGWPEQTQNLRKYYPLSLMATGHDILGLWVHRMVMLGLELTNKLPFKKVLLHGVICDNKGAKMSKSRGNVIDPIDVIEGISMENLEAKSKSLHVTGSLSKDELKKAQAYHKANFSSKNGIPECGVDALRFTLLSQDVKSHFVNFDVNICHANKLFCNKIWQSIKYTQLSCEQLPGFPREITQQNLTYFDKWILSRLADMVEKVNKYLDDHDFHLATATLRNHIYSEFCDTYLETTKPGFSSSDDVKVVFAHAHTLTAALNTALRCLNPFMVYLTQAAIPAIPKFQHNVIVNYNDLHNKWFEFPQTKDFKVWRDISLEKRVRKVLETASVARELKALCGMPNKLRPSIFIKTNDDNFKQDLSNNLPVVLNLARCCTLDFEGVDTRRYVRGLMDQDSSEVWIEALGTNVDNVIHAAKEKIRTKIEKLEKYICNMEKKYFNEKYLESKPQELITIEKEKLEAKKEELSKMRAYYERLKEENAF